MSTTSLFVELIVIGSGVLLWLALGAVGMLGTGRFSIDQPMLLASAIPVLSLVYVLGIVWDRVADAAFGRLWGDGLRESQFVDLAEYYDARRLILTGSPELSGLLEYGRSRLRICRGWALNAPMVTAAAEYYLFKQSPLAEATPLAGIVTAVAGLMLTLGCWFAWKSLTEAEYRKIREQAAYLRPQGQGTARPT